MLTNVQAICWLKNFSKMIALCNDLCDLVLGAKRDALGSSAQGVPSEEAAQGLDGQLGIIQRVSWHHCLVQVGVKGHALHVVALAHLYKGLPGRV